ncbi:ABC transporter substrate-binding protein [Rhodoferax sp.]|jgi:branched-chain amino acid transport system substrate-binding protein|uniref:ABC transporter substrate-binding protein n=2 Tax=Rhodoferax sp. TaxID=50421 RepID=UPI002717FF21|nr:ABC transporter substrate-binding protein [Rhodoferax sp.]MDO9144414.1 ABC transporter substrate-binding protein [Rhodoferax sp.]MDP1530802.1 ABC transporter substrate-binding protein [Rhodoferax sp.]MDP1945176.1 ABC transporter substrate-binding protein [Rhodoferax sp.]MDP2442905.1 ABC transporter substrate-binding protein [Rhodoferax sp.]MDP3191143.1 ABC transporter substrate-binding protein [Rhodoferax sp.]
MKLKTLVTALAVGFAAAASAQNTGPVKIGFITDMSSVYADLDGPAGGEMVKWAAQDFGGKVLNRPIEVLTADHQNKADVASSKAREWIDKDGLSMLIGGTNSGTSLAMAKLAEEKKRPFFSIGAGSARLTNEACSPYTVHYAYDTVALAKVGASALVKAGGKSWFFLTADYAFGHSLEGDASTIVKANGGTVAGAVRHPLNASDFSSFLLQAQSSKAQVLGLANAGGDFSNAMKSAKEFGITKTMKPMGLLVFITDVHSLGLANAEGLQVADSWYWNQDDASRKFAKRFFEKFKRMPTSVQAADYSAASNYLKAVQTAGTTDADKVMSTLKSMKIDDFYNKGQIRADGRMIHDMYLYQVKSSKDSTTPWDYYTMIAKVPGDQAFTTPAESKCALLKK